VTRLLDDALEEECEIQHVIQAGLDAASAGRATTIATAEEIDQLHARFLSMTAWCCRAQPATGRAVPAPEQPGP